MSAQVPFGTDSFADNPEPRCPCVLLLDTSGSMRGNPIAQLNAGVLTYKDELAADSLASKRVEVAIVTFGPVKVAQEFVSAASFSPTALIAGGDTPMGAAINQGIDLISSRKQEYRKNGIAFYRPWIFLVTDGVPTDEWHDAAKKVRDGETAKAFSFFAVGLEGADMELLRKVSARPPLQLDSLRFRDMFLWLSNSQKAVSQSTPNQTVALPKVDWSAV